MPTSPPPVTADHADFALSLAAAAGAEILPHFRNLSAIDNKEAGGFDPVTEADRAAERAMRALIDSRYPDHGVLGEEYGAKPGSSDFSWILDPIDGTRSFICGLPTWAVLIGLLFQGRPVLGVMHQPFVGETFLGTPAGSTWQRGGERRRLTGSPASRLSEVGAGTTNPRLYKSARAARALKGLTAAVRTLRHDADAYFFALVAEGSIGLAFDTGLAPYDIAPLIPIIEGAGGVVTDWSGGSAAGGGDIVAAGNRALHAEALGLVA